MTTSSTASDAVSRPVETSRLSAALGLSLILFAPLPVFFRHQEWSVWSFDGIALLLLIFLAALAAVWLPIARRRLGLGLIYAAALVFFVDFQYRPFEGRYSYLLAWIVGLALCWLLSAKLSQFAVIVFGLITALSLVPLPEPQVPHSEASRLPPIVHLVLDGHGSLASLPNEGRAAELKGFIRSEYTARGFRVMEDAFAFTDQTVTSLPAMLNGSVVRDELTSPQGGGAIVRGSNHFDRLVEQGYSLRITQTDHLDFCQIPSLEAAACTAYSPWSFGPLLSRMPALSPRRLHSIVGVVALRSRFLSRVKSEYEERRRAAAGGRWSEILPAWPRVPSTGAAVAHSALTDVTASARHTQGGEVFFVHLLSPHQPFLYSSDCMLKQPTEWTGDSDNTDPMHVVTEAYYDQVECVTKRVTRAVDELLRIERFQDATFLVHGDHGPRLLIETANEQVTSEAVLNELLLDSFSTFLAIRAPDVEAGLDQTPISVNQFIAETWHLDSWQGLPESLVSHFSKALRHRDLPIPPRWLTGRDVTDAHPLEP